MTHASFVFATLAICATSALAQTVPGSAFKLALPDHPGKLKWSADGFTVLQSSAKPNGNEIGIRGRDASHQLTFLAFLFVFPEQAPLTSAKCREGVLGPAEQSNPSLKIATLSEIARAGELPVAVATYSAKAKTGAAIYSVRGFVANGDLCGDLELYSEKPISPQ